MSEFTYIAPKKFINSVFGGQKPNNKDNYRVQSLLLILGLGEIMKRNSSSPISLHNNFALIPVQPSTRMTIREIKNLIFSNNSIGEIRNFFTSCYQKNFAFHQKICNELLTAIGYMEQNNPIASFVSIYRLYEQIALCLPIVTLIKKAQFPATFDDYKKLINNKAKSDLSVLKNYSENIMDPNIGDIDVEFDFSNTTSPNKYVSLLESLIPHDLRSTHITFKTPVSLRIKNKHMQMIVITFRNRYFHYLFNEKNIDYNDLPYPEEFLEVCNPLFINFYSQMYLDLLGSELYIWG